jgi:hypothetical protein
MTLYEEAGVLLISHLAIFLRKYAYQRPEFVNEVLQYMVLLFTSGKF